MKKVITILLVLSLLPALFSCKKKTKYPPVESTAEESRVMMTLTAGDQTTYTVRYELYRALYLALRSDIFGESEPTPGTPERQEAEEKLDALILSRIGDIFAAISAAKKIGYDAFDSEADKAVEEYIATSVNGGEGVIGFDGDYDAYLASLKAMGLNYAVQDLLYRYSLAHDALLAHETLPENKTSEQKAQDAKDADAFYSGDGSVLVLRAVLPAENFSEARAKEIASTLASKPDANAVAAYMVGFTTATIDDVKVGLLIGPHSMDEAYYGAMTDAAFALPVGGVSEPILISEDGIDRYYILYRTEKTEDYRQKNADYILDCYLSEKVGQKLAEEKDSLLSSVRYSNDFSKLDRSAIRME